MHFDVYFVSEIYLYVYIPLRTLSECRYKYFNFFRLFLTRHNRNAFYLIIHTISLNYKNICIYTRCKVTI